MDGPMTIQEMKYTPSPQQFKRMTTAELRDAFLIENVFVPAQITLHVLDLDRVIVGGAMPTNAPLELGAPPAIAEEFFNARRELGILNIGGSGSVKVDGETHQLARLDMLYT